MALKNTNNTYGTITRFFHWVSAALIATLIAVGLFMSDMAYSPEKLEIYALHKSFGLLVLFLLIGRLVWRLISVQPQALGTHKRWETILAKIVHVFFYAALAAIPLSGWLMSSAEEFPVPFFGLQMPDLVEKNEALFDFMKETHEILAFALLGVLALHIAGAFKHHILDRDETLIRMASTIKIIPVILLVIAGGFYLTVGYLVLKGTKSQSQIANISSVKSITSPQPVSQKSWTILHDQSSLTFEAQMYRTPFTGTFGNFDGTILFDPNDLQNAKADIRIDMSSVTSGNADRDSQILTADWFDIEHFPDARFQSLRFEALGDDRYIVIGTLTIRDVGLPVTLPFTLTTRINNQGREIAEMSGKIELNRLDFGIGQGEWSNDKTVATSVIVNVSLTTQKTGQ